MTPPDRNKPGNKPGQKPGTKPRPPIFGDSLPLGEVREMGEETGWAEWNAALEQNDRHFAHTAPMTKPAPPGADPRYAKTQPAPLSTSKDGAVPRRVRQLTADEVMVIARERNRVCPKPAKWAELFGMFPQWTPGADMPSPPLTGDWNRTPALAKRMALRDQIEWASQHDCLPQMLHFLRGLSEEEWHHMGD